MQNIIQSPGRIVTSGFAGSVGFGRYTVSVGAGLIMGGQRLEGYVYWGLGSGLSFSRVDVSWENIILRPGLTSDALAGAGFVLSASGGALTGLVMNANQEIIGVLGGLQTNAGVQFTKTDTIIFSLQGRTLPGNINNEFNIVRHENSDGTFTLVTTHYQFQQNQGTLRTRVIVDVFEPGAANEAPTLVSRAAMPTKVERITAPYTPLRCFLSGTPILMSDGTHKPIEQVRPGDFVMAFNPAILQGRGPLAPARVTRTFQNTTRCVINLRGLRMTPGHVCLTDNGAFDTIAAILARDATLIHQDATPIRARTGAAIASPEDAIITIRAPHHHTNTPCTIRVRAGIPCKPQGADQLMPLTTWLAAQGQTITPDGRPDDMPIDWPAGCSPWRFDRQASWRLTNTDGSHHIPDWVQTAIQHADAEHQPQHVANRVTTAVIGGTAMAASASSVGSLARTWINMIGGGRRA